MEVKDKVNFLSYFFKKLFCLPGVGRFICIQSFVFMVAAYPLAVQSENNIEFLDKKIINRLTTSVYEVVTPKIESELIEYSRELPFNTLSFKERNEKYHSIGTAFFINDKELMSAAHVFALEEFSLLHDFYIRDSKGNVYKVGDVKKYSNVRDIIIFELEEYPETVAPLEFSRNVEIGDTVFSVGNVQGEGISFRAGQVASFTLEAEYGQWENIRFTSPASPGNSGGPLVDVKGNAVGLIVKKNSSENHNVAVPIGEIDNLKDHAEFYIRNVTVMLSNEQNNITRDWEGSFDLPDAIPGLAKSSQNSLNEFYIKLGLDLEDKFKDTYFPKGKRFRAYLRNQQFIRQFGVLKSDVDFKEWSLRSHSSKRIPLEKNQDIVVSKSEISSFHIIIDKPDDMSLNDFINDPKVVMDNMLKGIPFTRTVGVEKIRLTSLGVPERTETWEDEVGRRWASSLWFVPYTDIFVYSHCLAYPKGAICNLDFKKNSELHKGYLSFVKQGYDEIAIGYEGEIVNWLEYFSLDKKYLPRMLEKSEMTLSSDLFEFKIADYSLLLDGGEISGTSNIHLHFGYSNVDLLAEDLLLFELFPRKGVKSHYRVQRYYSPSEFSSDEYKSTWNDIQDRTGDYSGDLIDKGKNSMVKNVIADTEFSFGVEGSKAIQSVYVIGCIYGTVKNDIKSECNSFTKGVRFNLNHQENAVLSELE